MNKKTGFQFRADTQPRPTGRKAPNVSSNRIKTQQVDNETAKYIITYFSSLLSDAERMAIKHTNSVFKLDNTITNNTTLNRIYREKGWLTSDQTVLDLLKDGFEKFELNAANRILLQNPNGVFFNNCPKCNRLARTPYARQCRFCGHSWHYSAVAQFKIEGTFQLPSKQFFLLGKILKGKINQGQFIDLTMLGLNKRPKIEIIEFALKREDGKFWEDIGIGTNDLTETEKNLIENQSSFLIPVDILDKA